MADNVQAAVWHLEELYDAAKARNPNRAANMYGEVSKMLDKIEASRTASIKDWPDARDFDELCARLRHV